MAAPKIHFTFVFLAIVFSLFSVYLAELCFDVSDCTVTGCGLGGKLVCDDEGKCTCKVLDATCTDGENVGVNCTRHNQDFCRKWYDTAPDHNCDCAELNNIHCIDGQCTCGYPPN
ncbi:uncharacterized protein LOC121389919 [Gigantopelta aegis]|uniref:uncharacterized protein LOC121389919 n=1 Tax=Gigantopelta aegis TaxID=1735272 RepID=UPI001B88C24D|nr:uncharacterized protein LOC121389919 [Gigantopelta aegis]